MFALLMMRSNFVAASRASCNSSSGVLDSGSEPAAMSFSRSLGEANAAGRRAQGA